MAYLDDFEKREQEERLRALRLKATDEEKNQLEEARSRLTAERKDYLDRCCNTLEERGIYKVKFEIQIAKSIPHDIAAVHIASDVRSIFDNAEREAQQERLRSDHRKSRSPDQQKNLENRSSETPGPAAEPPQQRSEGPLRAQPPEEVWQQTPGSKRATDASVAMRLGQRERMNNADMDRLESTGPRRRNYRLLDATEIQNAFGKPDPEKVDAREKEAQKPIQTQWKDAARGMTR